MTRSAQDMRPNEIRAAIETLDQQGYAVVPRFVEPSETSTVSRALNRLSMRGAGTRNLLERPWCRALTERLKKRLASALPLSYVGVQCTLFDKTPHRNWLVAIHQDLSIPVRAPVDHPSLRVWSKKEGGHF